SSCERSWLVNRTHYHNLDNRDAFRGGVRRQLYEQYDIREETPLVINGDRAPWIREGVSYLPQAIYNYDRYHLKKWINQSLSKRTKKERRKAYEAADDNDPPALLAAIAEAEKAETDEQKKEEISQLRIFILEN